MLKIIKKYILGVVVALVIINLILIVVLLSVKIKLNRDSFDSILDPDTYQAVFLSNDQIYFGHLKNLGSDSDFLLLTNVYYVRVSEDSVGQLLKLGQIEPHGPKDEMIINKGTILFWENLRLDSPVVKNIKSYK